MNLRQLTTLYRLAYRLNHLEYMDTLTKKIDAKLSRYPKFIRKLYLKVIHINLKPI
jgi:hypothetical protein